MKELPSGGKTLVKKFYHVLCMCSTANECRNFVVDCVRWPCQLCGHILRQGCNLLKNPVIIIFVFFFCFIQFMIIIASITSSSQVRPYRQRLHRGRNRIPAAPPIGQEFQRRTAVIENYKGLVNIASEDFYFPLLVDMLDVVNRVKRGDKIAVRPINNASLSFLLPHTDKCPSRGDIDLLILVKSAPGNTLARDVIRETWGKARCWGGRNVVRLFLLGTVKGEFEARRLRDENSLHDDIIQQDFVDHYFNNTYKMMMGFDWAVRYCKKAKFVFFVDDDYYVHPENVVSYIESVSEPLYARLIAGYVWRVASPVRTRRGPKGKWFISRREYPWGTYPAYCSAGAFIVSMPVVEDVNIAMRFTKYLRFDDVFLGLVLHKLLMVPLHLDRVYSFQRIHSKSQAYAHANVIASHGFKQPNDIFNAWRDMKAERFCLRKRH